MTTLYTPFDFAPVSTAATTSTTVAANTYAYAIPLSPACTINGVESFLTHTVLSATMTTLNIPVPLNFTGKILSGTVSGTKTLNLNCRDNAGTAFVAAQVSQASSTNALTAYFLNGVCINPSPASGVNYSTAASTVEARAYVVVLSASMSLTFTAANLTPVWVPSGTVLAGGSWIVTTYNKPS